MIIKKIQNIYSHQNYWLLSVLMVFFCNNVIAKSSTPDSLLLPIQARSAQITSSKLKKLETKLPLQKRGKTFYNNLESYSNSNLITRELHRIIIKPPKNKEDELGATISSEREFAQFKGRTIRNIDIKRLSPFGSSVIDTTTQDCNWIEHASNKTHTRTREFIIRNQLFIEKGTKIDPELLADNERVIRSLSYIEDVHVIVKPITNSTDSVDLLFIVKDVWSVGFDLFFKNANAGKIEIFDRNIAGTGTQLENTILYDKNQIGKTGFKGTYIVPNIYNSFISAQLDVTSAFHQNSNRFELNRSFSSKSIYTAGGISYEKTTDQITINQIDPKYLFPINYQRSYAWLGRKFRTRFLNYFNNPSFVVAASVYNDKFTARPPVSENSFQTYHNKTQYLGTFAFSHQYFFKTSLLNSFGRTEDIPVGYLHQFTFGVEKSEFRSRLYGELALSEGSFVNQIGYLYVSASLAGYRYRQNFNQSVLRINVNTFSNLLVYGGLKMRYLATVNYVNGFNRFYDEYLTLNDNNGLRGYTDPYLTGNQKLSINIEHTVFTPWSYLDFKLAVFSFADFGWIGRTAHSVFDNPLYSGFGVGFRIRNELLVFKTIQLRLAYYPKLSNNAAVSYFLFSSSDKVSPNNFYVQPPVIKRFE